MAEPDAAPAKWRLFAALFGLVLPVAVTVSVSPLLNSVAMDLRGLDSVQIGAVRTAEILLNACLALYLSTKLTILVPRTLGLTGAGLFLAGSLGGLVGTGLVDLAIARLIAGAGAACLGAAGAALYGQFSSPQRASGMLVAPWTMASVAAVLVAGDSAKAHSQTGVFGVLAVAAVIGAVFIACMPGGRSPAHAAAPALPILKSLRSPYVLGAGCVFFGSTALWHFFARVGMSHGLEPDQVSKIIATASVLSGVLGAIAILVRDRWVRNAMLAAVAIYAVMSTTVALSPTALIYLAAYGVQSVAYIFVSILMPTVGIRLDRTGATNTAANGVTTMANAMAPLTAGVLVQGGSFLPLGAMCAGAGVLAFTLLFIASRSPQARAPAPAPAA
jgi:predicted MFS family arabinose efflux permease